MEKKPTLTSTKAEILEAYNDLLKRKETENSKNPKEERAQEQKTETVKYAAALSSEDIVKGLTGVKLQISSALDNVENTLLMQFTKLEKLQEAIRYESSYVEDLYGIKGNADSLAILIAANKEKKQFFEKDLEERKRIFDELMLEKKLSWEKEQKERTQQWKEEEELRKKLIKREEDEYRYLQATNRKKEEDEYLSKKSAQEKELVEKKNTAALSQQEKQLTIQHKYEKDLFAKETEGELRLLQQKISSLEGRIKEQDTLIRTLNDKANTAGSQVQEIAMKALDSAAALRLQSVEKREEKEK